MCSNFYKIFWMFLNYQEVISDKLTVQNINSRESLRTSPLGLGWFMTLSAWPISPFVSKAGLVSTDQLQDDEPLSRWLCLQREAKISASLVFVNPIFLHLTTVLLYVAIITCPMRFCKDFLLKAQRTSHDGHRSA